jgi:hypothetical protein
MRRMTLFASCFLALPLAAACAQGSTAIGLGGSGRGGGDTTETGGGGSGGGASSSGSSAPTSCAQASGYAGCCVGDTFYYCGKSSGGVTPKPCPSGQTCGWDATGSYYACVAPPGVADPSGQHPRACQ